MKRISLLLVVGTLFLTMIPGVASADTFRCPFFADFCFGTENSDTIFERFGNESTTTFLVLGAETSSSRTTSRGTGMRCSVGGPTIVSIPTTTTRGTSSTAAGGRKTWPYSTTVTT